MAAASIGSSDNSPEKMSTGRNSLTLNESEVDAAAVLDTANEGELDPETALKIRQKIDHYLMPMMCLLYMMTFVDKITLSQSAVLGIIESAHLNTNQFNWLGSVFYLSYLVFEYPQNLALQRYPVGKWMSLNIFIWSIALLCHAACTSFGGLFAVRFILGACEGAITPGFMIVTAMFYTREEQTKRVGYWFLMNGFAIIFLGFVCFGLAHTTTPGFAPWQWVMVVTGILTLIIAVLFWFLFPDTPMNARFLNEEERKQAVQRIKVNQTGVENKTFKKDQFIATIKDKRVWLMMLFAAILNLFNSVVNQRQLIVSQFGFNAIQTTLLGCVDGVVEILFIWIAVMMTRIPQLGRVWSGVIMFFPSILGAILVNTIPSRLKVGLLFSYWLSGVGIVPFVIFLGWVGSVTAGHTRRITTNAFVLIGYCIGNFAGPFAWQAQYKPRNHAPWAMIAVAEAIACGIFILLRQMYDAENKRRDRDEAAGQAHDATFDHVHVRHVNEDGQVEMRQVDKAFLDLTDLENKEFRYVL